ncbi:fatty acid synthase-like [Camponotus floridanus]|uniref:fatty acid synthase-like n=1 Tax=Camponotus floridanus TaxID=104421 RepID=UPI000DC69501|nr:fatty acid synthase-like [Camponotus floridanus]
MGKELDNPSRIGWHLEGLEDPDDLEGLGDLEDLEDPEDLEGLDAYEMPARMGKMDNIEKFDAKFFNMSIEEAHTLDPGIRILLENTYAAIIDAGVNPAELQGTRTGVVTVMSNSETSLNIIYEKPHIAGLPMLGCNKSMLANRISYFLNVTGPSYNIDTACSTSSLAMVKAYNLIRSEYCDAVASVRVLSADGYCKPCDEEGTGYMRSEAATVVFLQKAKDARRIYATFVYGKANCDDFKEEGITFPSLDKQKLLLEEFYKDCNVSPPGDSVELQAIDEALCIKRDFPLLMGSVKSNIGHSEPVSGHCQIAKVSLQQRFTKWS